MSKFATKRAREFYAQTYDVTVSDWPGEIDFYRELAAHIQATGQAVLEVACGTGRVAIRLSQEGVEVVGLDLSTAMLDVARRKSGRMSNLRWVEADMHSFDLGETFGLVIIPGHAFQNILAVSDQLACLDSIHRHLAPGGRLVVHVDRLDRGPIRLHCVFPFEMEHLLARAGFAIETVYGDFYRQALGDDSSELILVSRCITDPGLDDICG